MARKTASTASARKSPRRKPVASSGKKSGATAVTPAAQAPAAKSIVLFSDGTGNSSGKLFKTNVWRMYEAVDLGPSAPGRQDQIAYYDNGVGTSGFKPVAILGGIFGVGLKRNVLDIYQYACRNYNAHKDQGLGSNRDRLGDHIYGFGFSRGAFTMRTVISLIADQGLVPYTDDEQELARRSRDAYRAHCSPGAPRYLKWLVRGYRKVRGKLSDQWRKLRGIPIYDPAQNHHPVIRFIGVWDTVSAYGGPIAEITRAIDNWFFPISMPNYKLRVEVECARHALALDDERDSFHPLLWDEIHEQEMIAKRAAGVTSYPEWIDEDRLEQVWFTGMHADVGGGYPDESLSYVSLLWMLEEAEKVGLRTLDVVSSRYRAMANSYGPMHDSRAGIGSYYRYQPRRIAAWLDPVRTDTLSLRDPAIADDSGKPKGLVPEHGAKVHESVIARIQDGTDSYAPIVLPARFQIVPPSAGGENQPQSDSETQDSAATCVLRAGRRVLPLLEPGVARRFVDTELGRQRAGAIEQLWNLVLVRRLTYFLTVLTTVALLSMPLWIENAPDPLSLTNGRTFGWETLFLNDGRNWIGSLVRLLALFLPAFMEGWIETYATNPFYFVALGAAIILLLALGKMLKSRMHDRARAAWLPTVAGAAASRPDRGGSIKRWIAALVQRIRMSGFYQRGVQITKWHVLPNVIFMPILLFLGSWIMLIIVTQLAMPTMEGSLARCRDSGWDGRQIQNRSLDFHTDRPCNSAGGMVENRQRYNITFEVREPWSDGDRPTTPIGLSPGEFPLGGGYLGVPLRRVIDARFLQPLIAIRSTAGGRQRLHIYPLTLTPSSTEPSTGAAAGGTYVGEFVAPTTGEVVLFSNDVMLPFGRYGLLGFSSTYFYNGSDEVANQGSACVTIRRSQPLPRVSAVPNYTSLCPDPSGKIPPPPPARR